MRGRVGKGLGRCFVALALAEILCFQSLMGTGVAQALAPTVDDVAAAGQVEAPAPRDEAAEPVDWTQHADAVSVTAGELGLEGGRLATMAADEGGLPQQLPANLPLTVTVSEQVGEGPRAYELLCDGQVGMRVSDDPRPPPSPSRLAPSLVAGAPPPSPATPRAPPRPVCCLPAGSPLWPADCAAVVNRDKGTVPS